MKVITAADLDAAPIDSLVFAPGWGSYIKVAKRNMDPWWCPPNDFSMPFPVDQLAGFSTLLLEPVSDVELAASISLEETRDGA